VLRSSFAGLTMARFIRENSLTVVPSVQIEVLTGHGPRRSLRLDRPEIRDRDAKPDRVPHPFLTDVPAGSAASPNRK